MNIEITEEIARDLLNHFFDTYPDYTEERDNFEYSSHEFEGDNLRIVIKKRDLEESQLSIKNKRENTLFGLYLDVTRSVNIQDVYNHPIVTRHYRNQAIGKIIK